MLPSPMVTAVTGPGAMTPVREMNTAPIRKVRRGILIFCIVMGEYKFGGSSYA
ncbi:MAG: hypothetical protein SVM80_10240 [Halobacteriota archaeon]|nr:hypothetical protein [Halobacteriota archaeon]